MKLSLDWNEIGPKTIYLDRYLSLIDRRRRDEKVKGDWLERHHIYPKSIFGENKDLVILDIRTHILAHELLWRHLKKIRSRYAYKMGLVMARMAGAKKNQYDARDVKFSSRQLLASRAAMHESMKGENNPFYGKNHSEETKLKISQSNTGKTDTDETKAKKSEASKKNWRRPEYAATLSAAISSRIIKQETRDKLSLAHKGKIVSQEARNKISVGNKGKLLGVAKSEETKRRMSETNKGKKKSEDHINKINKNLEKIRKTAEKHTGMKRSEETKRNISEAKKGKSTIMKGKKSFFDPTSNIVLFFGPDDIIPCGFIRGNPHFKGKSGAAGKLWWYDPINMVKDCFAPNKQPPGWIRGNPRSIISAKNKEKEKWQLTHKLNELEQLTNIPQK